MNPFFQSVCKSAVTKKNPLIIKRINRVAEQKSYRWFFSSDSCMLKPLFLQCQNWTASELIGHILSRSLSFSMSLSSRDKFALDLILSSSSSGGNPLVSVDLFWKLLHGKRIHWQPWATVTPCMWPVFTAPVEVVLLIAALTESVILNTYHLPY